MFHPLTHEIGFTRFRMIEFQALNNAGDFLGEIIEALTIFQFLSLIYYLYSIHSL